MRLLCDEMLGRLARWLRLLGIDTAYRQGDADEDLLEAARREGRVLLTRDARLAATAGPGAALLVASLEPEEQLAQVVAALDLPIDEGRILTRCSLCNAPLEPATRAEAEGKVPPAVFAVHDTYWRCPRCERLYWRGTHTARIEATLRALRAERGP